jgi:hypothetical protein
VRLRFPAAAELQLTWREPTARVRSLRGATFVVDHDGVVVPSSGLAAAARAGRPMTLPLIVGLRVERADITEKISDPAIDEALKLAALVKGTLDSAPVKLNLAEMRRADNGTWTLATDRGLEIIWGVYSEYPPMDEPKTAGKLSLLARRLLECGDPAQWSSVNLRVPNAPMELGGRGRRDEHG